MYDQDELHVKMFTIIIKKANFEEVTPEEDAFFYANNGKKMEDEVNNAKFDPAVLEQIRAAEETTEESWALVQTKIKTFKRKQREEWLIYRLVRSAYKKIARVISSGYQGLLRL